MQLNVGVRAKHATPGDVASWLVIRVLVESYCTTIVCRVLQSGLQVEHFWPPASCCTGPLKSYSDRQK